MLFTLAPNARFGYFAYPAAILGWLALTGRVTSPEGRETGVDGPPAVIRAG